MIYDFYNKAKAGARAFSNLLTGMDGDRNPSLGSSPSTPKSLSQHLLFLECMHNFRRRDFQTDWRTGGLRTPSLPNWEKASTYVLPKFQKASTLGTFYRNYNYSVGCPCNIYTCANRISMRLFFDLRKLFLWWVLEHHMMSHPSEPIC